MGFKFGQGCFDILTCESRYNDKLTTYYVVRSGNTDPCVIHVIHQEDLGVMKRLAGITLHIDLVRVHYFEMRYKCIGQRLHCCSIYVR